MRSGAGFAAIFSTARREPVRIIKRRTHRIIVIQLQFGTLHIGNHDRHAVFFRELEYWVLFFVQGVQISWSNAQMALNAPTRLPHKSMM
jgi:hypothetical protein